MIWLPFTLSLPNREHYTLSNMVDSLSAASETLAGDISRNVNSMDTSFIVPKGRVAIEAV